MRAFLAANYKVPFENIGVLSGPCHAEEVALERLSFLTVASKDPNKAALLSEAINSRILTTRISDDVVGIELAAVLKNIYAIAAGICQGLLYGDNFQAVLMSNCAKKCPLSQRRATYGALYRRTALPGRHVRILAVQPQPYLGP